MGQQPLEIFFLLQRGERLESSESDVCKRQILMTKVAPALKGLKFWVVEGITFSG